MIQIFLIVIYFNFTKNFFPKKEDFSSSFDFIKWFRNTYVNSQYNHMFIMNESAFKRSAGLSILQTSWIIKVGMAIQNCSCYGIMPIMMSSYTISEKFVKYHLDGQKWHF